MSTNSVSSSTSSSLTTLSAKTGIAGLMSGLDTEEIVNSLTLATQQKITKQEQKLQLLEWKQTAYQSVTTALKEFQSSYLDVLSGSNFTSESLFNTIAASTSSSAYTVTASSSVTSSGSITIDSITQLATSQTFESNASVTGSLNGTYSTDYSTDFSGKSFLMTKDGMTKTVTIGTVTDEASFKTELQAALDDSFGTGVVSADFSTAGKVEFLASGSSLKVANLSGSSVVDDLGMTSGQSNTLSTSSTLADLNLSWGTLDQTSYSFSINDVEFSFNSTDTLATVMKRVNSSDAGVTMSYSSITDTFKLTADDSGAGSNISVSDSDLLTAFGLNNNVVGNTIDTEGQNAILSVNGKTITRSSNEVDVNGVKVTLLEETAVSSTINLTTDTTDLKDKITSFVEDYNTMIDLINGLVKEDKESDYEPLTDAQKEEMSESEIEKWEAKAKSGILRGDSILRGITSKMQTLMYSSAVKGGLTLYDMGIESAGYTENGKLEIDEDKLVEVLSSNIEGVKELFTTETTGIANALDSIIDDAAKTSGARGSRGTLIEKAGYESTTSSTQNSIYDNIQTVNEYITKLQDQLESEESRYWSKFTALETALSQLNAQSSMISGFGSNS
ncbi:flagellar filament capping protein FliD [Eubacteriaceae bacterium ES3]|nr:flagellar filament capping protein FliD [Eubacteriaceae bacterium ES3]